MTATILATLGIVFALIAFALIAYVLLADEGYTNPKNKHDQDRAAANFEILRILIDYAANQPTQRFGQILRNTGIIQDIGVRDSSKPEWETPDFYIDRMIVHEEPWVILERMKKELAEQAKNR